MSDSRRALALQASHEALTLRRTLNVGLTDSISPYDIAEQLGIDVRFFDLSSLEGIYCRSESPLIVLSSQRPRTRQVFTCAHELGHHVFGHGTRFDQAVAEVHSSRRFDEREYLADCFAGMLLMPKTAIVHAFAVRRWSVTACTAVQVYTVASWFGVGYETLIQHLTWSLRLMSPEYAARLLKEPLKRVRTEVTGTTCDSDVVVVDRLWTGRSIDINVGGLVLLPYGTTSNGSCIQYSKSTSAGVLLEGKARGIGTVTNSETGWRCTARVSRPGYVGLAVYRYLEDPDDEQ